MIDTFTCSRISLNTNGSRALRLFSLEFVRTNPKLVCKNPDEIEWTISGLTTKLLLFEQGRITDRPEGEPNFHIFYYFLAGLDDDSK